jgi:hypothetical protein
MPITQSRMITVLDAYRAILNHYDSATTELEAALTGMAESGNLAKAQEHSQKGEYVDALRSMALAFDDLRSIAKNLMDPTSPSGANSTTASGWSNEPVEQRARWSQPNP